MPNGEFHTFLSVLLSASNQLGVAISDIQASIADGSGPQPGYRLQFAMALVAAARTLRGVATAMQSGIVESSTASSMVAAQGEHTETSRTSTGHHHRAPTAMPGASSDSEDVGRMLPHDSSQGQKGLGDDSANPEAQEGRGEEEAVEFLEPIPEVVLGSAPGPNGSGSFVAVTGGGDANTSDEDAMPSAVEAAQVMRMLPQLFGQATQPEGMVGVGQPQDDGLAAMPPEVVSCWQRWTQPQLSLNVLEPLLQPPFSEAYLYGDATGSHRPPVLPHPIEFLPLQWSRTADRTEDMQDLPESPEHLSRAYLSAFLRDIGQHVRRSATFASIPDASERYPHLRRIADFAACQGNSTSAYPELLQGGGNSSAGQNDNEQGGAPPGDATGTPSTAEPGQR